MKFIEAYKTQRKHARERGIGFFLSYEEWIEWWGEDIEKRGRGKGKLQMCRYHDEGFYELGNIYKSTHEDNIRLRNELGNHKSKILSADEISTIENMLKQGFSTRKIAFVFVVSQKTIMRIKQGKY